MVQDQDEEVFQNSHPRAVEDYMINSLRRSLAKERSKNLVSSLSVGKLPNVKLVLLSQPFKGFNIMKTSLP